MLTCSRITLTPFRYVSASLMVITPCHTTVALKQYHPYGYHARLESDSETCNRRVNCLDEKQTKLLANY
jgi:hypothetical protein